MLVVNKFDGEDNNFNMWKIRIVSELKSQNLVKYLTTSPYEKSTREIQEDQKALIYISRCLSDRVFSHYCNLSTTKKLWKNLLRDYSKKDAQQLAMKRNEFFTSTKSANETMRDFINRLERLRDELVDATYVMTDQDFILTIITGTHTEFGTYVSSIAGKQYPENLSIRKFCNLMIREDDLRRSDYKKAQENRVMFTGGSQNNGTGQKRKKNFKSYKSKKFKKDSSFQNSNSDDRKDKYKSKSKSSKHNRLCYNCHKKGHYAKECRSPKSIVVPAQTQNGKDFVGNCQEDNSNINISQRGYVLFDNLACTTNDNMTDCNRWLLDSGASMHICNNKSWFIDLAPENSSVLVGDNRHIQVLGRGTVNINGVINNLM